MKKQRKHSKKLSKLKIDVPIFNYEVDLRFMDVVKLPETIKEEYGVDIDCMEDAAGVTYDLDGDCGIYGTVLIGIENFFTGKKTRAFAILMHESLHAAMIILKNRGIKVSTSDDETLAYLQQFIVEAVLNAIEEGNNGDEDESND